MAYCVPGSFARYGQGQEAHGSRHFRPAAAAAAAWFGFPPWASTSVSGESCGYSYIWDMLADFIGLGMAPVTWLAEVPSQHPFMDVQTAADDSRSIVLRQV